jgi:cytidine deaminase
MDFTELIAAARRAAANAYVPYSHYPVGAAGLTADGRVLTGCNVENASYGMTLCAECGLISALAAAGGGRLTAFTCVNGAGAIITPCGRCRQLLLEHGGPALLVWSPTGQCTLADLLPQSFGPDDLTRYAGSPTTPGQEPYV